MSGRAAVAGAAAVLLVSPLVLPSYQLGVLTKMLIFSIFAMSLNLTLGYAGLPSLGHAAYFGVFSAMALIMVILGGAGTLLGPVVGSFVIVCLENLVSAYTQRWVIVLGLIYIAVTLLAPAGLVGLVVSRARRQPA
jgi:ABC-type branched-subunit amino acid transport system permease subunit